MIQYILNINEASLPKCIECLYKSYTKSKYSQIMPDKVISEGRAIVTIFIISPSKRKDNDELILILICNF